MRRTYHFLRKMSHFTLLMLGLAACGGAAYGSYMVMIDLDSLMFLAGRCFEENFTRSQFEACLLTDLRLAGFIVE